MRVCYVLLVAATTLFASTLATADADQTTTKPDSIQSINGDMATAAKRFLRSNKLGKVEDDNDEGSDEDSEEERAFNGNVLDDVLGKAVQSTLTDDALKKLVTVHALKTSRTDKDLTLFKTLYDGKVNPDKFAWLMNYNTKSNMEHKFEDVYKAFKWYTLFHNP